nr:unnamed protein product [Digitaria exilis]
MAAATARAPAADKRYRPLRILLRVPIPLPWGFAAAAAAAAPTRTAAVGVVETAAPNPTNQSTQRGAFPWGDKPMPPAPNVWVSSSPLSLKNDGVSGHSFQGRPTFSSVIIAARDEQRKIRTTGLPHLMHGKVKDNHSDALEKQVIKKDVALLEKIRCLNIKARKLRAAKMSGISSCRESKVEHPKSMDVVANDAPVSANISDITSSFDMANSVSESSNHVLNGTSDMSANLVMIDLSEGHATKFSEARKPVQVRTADDMINSSDYEIQHPRRKLYSQYAKRLPEQERWKIKQPVKSIAKLDDLNKHRFVQKHKSDDAPAKSAEYHVYGGNASINRHGSSAEDVSFKISGLGWEDHPTVDSLPVLTNTNEDQSSPGNTTYSNTLEHTAWKSAAQSHDSSAPKHLQAEDSEGQVHKQESISRVSTPASDIADANKGPLVDNAIPSAKNADTNMIHIDQKGASESHDRTAPMHLQMQDKRKAHSQGRISRGLPASEPAGVNKGFFTHNLIPSSQNNGINATEHIAQKSASQSHENNAPEHLQMEIRRQVRSEEGVLRERSNIADSTENATTIDGTLVDTWNSEAKPHADLSTQSKSRRPTSPLVFVTKNTEASRVHKAHISGVVINNAIIPVQASSIKGFTVGSIMLGDASLASVKQEKTVAKEVNDDVTHSCSSPKQTKQSGMNQHDEHHVNPHASGDSIMHTPVNKDQSKKENSEVGGLNCTANPACTQPSGNQSSVSQNVAPVETSQMERHTQTPACKELDLQNPRQMLPTENHATSSGNSSESKLDTKTLDKEALDARTSTKAEVKTEPGSREDEKTKKHPWRSSASSKQGSTNGSASRAPDHYEQETNSFLKMMQELSDELKQVEKQLESSTSIDAATVNRLQPAQMVSLPGYTWGEHHMSRGHRQYHVDGQGNTWVNYAANSHPDGSVMAQGLALPTTHLLHNIYIPQNNVPGVNSAPGWSWDTAERVLISDMDDTQGFGTAITAKSGTAPAQNVLPRVGEMDVMLGVQAMGGMAYTPAAHPEVLHHTGTELQQLNPAAPPVAAWTDGSAIVPLPAGYHPAEARGAVYYV